MNRSIFHHVSQKILFPQKCIVLMCLFFSQRTTLILLCEDGSLRIYMANVENTGFWMSPSMQPSNAISVLKPSKKKKVTKTGKSK